MTSTGYPASCARIPSGIAAIAVRPNNNKAGIFIGVDTTSNGADAPQDLPIHDSEFPPATAPPKLASILSRMRPRDDFALLADQISKEVWTRDGPIARSRKSATTRRATIGISDTQARSSWTAVSIVCG